LVWRTSALHPKLRTLGNIAGVCLIAQILLGVATYKMRLQVEPLTVAHQAMGATLLGTLVCFSILALRDRQSSVISYQSSVISHQ
jgi:cytochrome c oxidase assembly protein subunit 15